MANNIWNKLSEEDKDLLRKSYNEMKEISNKNKDLYENMLEDQQKRLEMIFGKENLNPEPQIKTWEDYLESIKDKQAQSLTGGLDKVSLDSGYVNRDFPVFRKAIATFKIAKLIELGYGGMITDEEWKKDTQKHIIDCAFSQRHDEARLISTVTYSSKHLIAFHTIEQRDEFLRNNEQLCKDYYML